MSHCCLPNCCGFVCVSCTMTKDQIDDLSFALTGYVLKLGRAPKRDELRHFITHYLRGRKNGRIMAHSHE